MLPVPDYPYRLPTQPFPWIEVVRIPDLHPVTVVSELAVWRFAGKSSLGRLVQLRQVSFQTRHSPQPRVSDHMKKRGGGELSICHHVVRKPEPQILSRPPQQPLTGGILAVSGAIGFHIQRERQTRSHHADHRELVMMPDD